MKRRPSYRLEDLPIPADVKPGKGWSPAMWEMADHIGAYAVLQICEEFGGQTIYISVDPTRNVLRELIGPEKAAIISHVYGREKFPMPTGNAALYRARRAGIVALVRQRKITVSEGAAIVRCNRSLMSKLVNQTDEGVDTRPVSLPRAKHDPRQLDMFADDSCEAEGVH
ncbi:hypothetical protein [Sphingobium aquiterrae]|uniref:hypothetical protein n=1 Tax=Sphingobium aquiterrae TaxID=2038656 RepID=UPI00301AA28B